MNSDTPNVRISVLFALLVAIGMTGVALLRFSPQLNLLTVINRSDQRQRTAHDSSNSLPIPQAEAIAALKHLGATVDLDASGKSAKYVMVFQEFLFGADGYHRFSDSDMKYVAALHELEQLHIIETSITDKSLECLTDLPRIHSLTLRNYNHTDAAVDFIRQLQHLEYLDVSQTQITDSGIEILRRRFPHCEIRSTGRPTINARNVRRDRELRR